MSIRWYRRPRLVILSTNAASAAKVLAAVGVAVAESVTSGQMDDVRGQLPEGLRGVFSVSEAGPPNVRGFRFTASTA